MAPRSPVLIAHADWSRHVPKRSIAVATRDPGGCFLAHAPEGVPDAPRLPAELRSRAGGALGQTAGASPARPNTGDRSVRIP